MPRISVIIPCYNQGAYVDEAIASVLAQTYQDFEIFVVNDGSTDPATITTLNALNYPKTKVVHTPNLGLPGARNLGIQNASGEFILPLDADDKIAPTYLEKALSVITTQPAVGIVYCKAWMFGTRSGPWDLPDYKFPDILLSPRIHCTALFRKTDWEKVGGYSSEMIHGWEDYDFWLSLIEMGREVHCIPEVLFYYRQHESSMITALDKDRASALTNILFRRHRKLYEDNLGTLFGSVLLQESNTRFLKNSLDFKLGRAVLAPFREIARFFKRLKKPSAK